MRRARRSRVLRALVGLWLAVALSEPAALHACAMHGGQDHPAASPGHGHSAGAHASRQRPAHPAHHAACSCLGRCCAAVAAAVPAAHVALARPSAIAATRALPHRAIRFRLPEPAFARPPSHAPPKSPA